MSKNNFHLVLLNCGREQSQWLPVGNSGYFYSFFGMADGRASWLFTMPLVILQGPAWLEIGRSRDRSEDGRRKQENNAQATTDRTVGKMSESKGMVCKRAEIMKRARTRKGIIWGLLGFLQATSTREFCSKKKKELNTNDQRPLGGVCLFVATFYIFIQIKRW